MPTPLPNTIRIAVCLVALWGLPGLAQPSSKIKRIEIPADIRSITVDGMRLRLAPMQELDRFAHPMLYMPRGRHLVRWDAKAYRVSLADHSYAPSYRSARDKIAAESDGGRRTLLARLVRVFDTPDEAETLHLLGNRHYHAGDKAAARRLWCRAVLVNPAFAPSHLNLAFLEITQGNRGPATRELGLARAFNVGDTFGISAAIEKLSREHRIDTAATSSLQVRHYTLGTEEKTDELDRRFITFYTGAGRYFKRWAERAKLYSNLALYFATGQKSGAKKPVLARKYYRVALGALVKAGRTSDNYKVAAVILKNLGRACAASGWTTEAEDYKQMAELSEKQQ